MFDIQQIMFGDTTPAVLLEIVFRTAVMYLYLLLLLRGLGARGLAQLSVFEFAIIIALGSAVGDGMFYLDIPLIEAMLVITVVVIIQRVIIWATNRNAKLEEVLEGKPYTLVENGILNNENMFKTALSHDEVFMELREAGAEHLGQVKYACLEVNGRPSVFLTADGEASPGLPIVPPWEIRRPTEIRFNQTISQAGHYACANCGTTKKFSEGETVEVCMHCQHDCWMPASIVKVSGHPNSPS